MWVFSALAMAAALEEANTGVSQTLKDLFSGAVGGVAQVLIGVFLVCYQSTSSDVLTCYRSTIR